MILISHLVDYLEDEGVGVRDADLHPGFMPSSPDNAIAVRNTGGYPPHGEVELVESTFQVLVRNTTEPGAIEKSWEIYSLLNRLTQQTLKKDGIILRWCYALSPPTTLGHDENARALYSTNYRTSVYEDQMT